MSKDAALISPIEDVHEVATKDSADNRSQVNKAKSGALGSLPMSQH